MLAPPLDLQSGFGFEIQNIFDFEISQNECNEECITFASCTLLFRVSLPYGSFEAAEGGPVVAWDSGIRGEI